MKKLLSTAVATASLAFAGGASAVTDAEFAELKAQMAAMSQRLSALEAENSQLRDQASATDTQLATAQTDLAAVKKQNEASAWSERVSVKGDFRYRYEGIDVEHAKSRDRNRIRARSELTARLPSDVIVGIGIASGGDDPVSSNQTLGGGGTSKDLALDLAYFQWEAVDNLFLGAGKFKNPLWSPDKNQLLWDGDWRPEGLNASWAGEVLFANAIGNWLESDSAKQNDEFAWGVQVGTNFDLGSVGLTAAAGYYDIPVKGNEPYYKNDFFGNSNVNGLYQYDYELVELSAQLSMELFDLPFSVWGDYVENQDPDDYNTGWLAGVGVGKVKGKGSWELKYQYEDLEADGAFGLVSDSDFAGGGTDGKGSRLSGGYGINDQWSLAFTWFIDNKAGEKNLKDQGGALQYDRYQLDTQFKF